METSIVVSTPQAVMKVNERQKSGPLLEHFVLTHHGHTPGQVTSTPTLGSCYAPHLPLVTPPILVLYIGTLLCEDQCHGYAWWQKIVAMKRCLCLTPPSESQVGASYYRNKLHAEPLLQRALQNACSSLTFLISAVDQRTCLPIGSMLIRSGCPKGRGWRWSFIFLGVEIMDSEGKRRVEFPERMAFCRAHIARATMAPQPPWKKLRTHSFRSYFTAETLCIFNLSKLLALSSETVVTI